MQSVRQHVQLGVRPGNELAVQPDEAVLLVEGYGHGFAPEAPGPRTVRLLRRSLSPGMFSGLESKNDVDSRATKESNKIQGLLARSFRESFNMSNKQTQICQHD
jgi:hypothetical protein